MHTAPMTAMTPQPDLPAADADITEPDTTGLPGRRRPGRPPAAVQDQYRERLLRLALDSFLEKGFDGASLNAIAKASGISRDTFYRQYGSKAELFLAATSYGLERLADNLRIVLSEEGTMEQVLIRAALKIEDEMTSPSGLPIVRLVISESHKFPEVAARMFQNSRVQLAPLVDYLARQRQLGLIAVEDPFDAAFMLATLSFGGVRMFMDQTPRPLAVRQQWAAQVVRSLLTGWRTPAAATLPAGSP